MKVLEVENEFKELIKNEKVLVDFYADWCGPCKMLGPVLETVESIDVLKVNVDMFPNLAREYGVMSIPTLVFFKDGNVVSSEIGFKSKDDIDEIVSKL